MNGADFSPKQGVSHALDRLRRHIDADRAAPEHRLPPEPDLARQLDLDPCSLARAVDVLCAEGRLRRLPDGRLRPARAARDDSALAEPGALMEARLRLEPELAGLAALRATPADVSSLNRLSARVVTAPDISAQEMWNSALHRLIAETAGNRHLLAAFDALDRARRSDPAWIAATQACVELLSGEPPLVEADHGAVIDAIASGDPDAAACRMNDHLLMVSDMLAAARVGARH